MPYGIDTGSPVRARPLMPSWTAAELEREVGAGAGGYWRTARAASPSAGLREARTVYTSDLLAGRRCAACKSGRVVCLCSRPAPDTPPRACARSRLDAAVAAESRYPAPPPRRPWRGGGAQPAARTSDSQVRCHAHFAQGLLPAAPPHCRRSRPPRAPAAHADARTNCACVRGGRAHRQLARRSALISIARALTALRFFRALARVCRARAQGVYVSSDTWRNLRRQLDVKLEDSHTLVHEHNKARRPRCLRAQRHRLTSPAANSLP
jgi:hypothetical protein